MKRVLKKKKGFTLVELLAVIVVLAIIMVIATQQINNVIKSSRANAFYDSVQAIRKATQTACVSEGKINSVTTLQQYVDFQDVDVVFGTDDYIRVFPKSGGKFDNMASLAGEVDGQFTLVEGDNSIIFKSECSINATNMTEKMKINSYGVSSVSTDGDYNINVESDGNIINILGLSGDVAGMMESTENINDGSKTIGDSAVFKCESENNKFNFEITYDNTTREANKYYCVIEIENTSNLTVIHDFGAPGFIFDMDNYATDKVEIFDNMGNSQTFTDDNSADWGGKQYISVIPNYLAIISNGVALDKDTIMDASRLDGTKLKLKPKEKIYFLVESVWKNIGISGDKYVGTGSVDFLLEWDVNYTE